VHKGWDIGGAAKNAAQAVSTAKLLWDVGKNVYQGVQAAAPYVAPYLAALV
jgi:hypothetical protein